MTLISLITTLVYASISYALARHWNIMLCRILGMGYLIVRGVTLIYIGVVFASSLMPLAVGVLMLILAWMAWRRGTKINANKQAEQDVAPDS